MTKDSRVKCLFCDIEGFRESDVFLENEYCLYAADEYSSELHGVLPGSGIIVPASTDGIPSNSLLKNGRRPASFSDEPGS